MVRAPSIVPHRATRTAKTVLPARIEPMLAVAGELPVNPEQWGFEYKWDGVRCISYWDGKALRLLSRNHIAITQRYPELADLGRSISKRGAILDGEIVALDAAGRPSFAMLQQRMHVDHPPATLVRQTPAYYMIFDILYADGKSVMDESYADRRARLENIVTPDEHWQLSPWYVAEGPAMLAATRKSGMEGIVAKLLNSPYLPGRRSHAWRKIKVVLGQELVIGGWIPQAGDRRDRVGALLLGYHDADDRKKLHYAGRVGTGFSDATHAMLVAALKPLFIDKNPFTDPVPRSGVTFVKPALVAEVEYRRWPAGGMIQQASFKGVRFDKPARDIVRESRGAS